MAIYSMTGFGRGETSARGLKAGVELKSVNHKQFDCRIDVPPSLAALEPSIRKFIHSKIGRGHVECRVRPDYSAAAGKSPALVDETLAGAYLARLRRAGRRLGLRDDLACAALLRLPGVVRLEAPDENCGRCRALLRAALGQATETALRMRAREGRALARDVAGRLRRLQKLADRIGTLAPLAVERQRRAFAKRMAAAGLELAAGDPRLIKEAALFADRMDIAEELMRLRSHLRQCFRALDDGAGNWQESSERGGRTLDFLAQELFREINTVGAKANDIRISAAVVRFKTELERVREQAQNIA